MNVITSYLVTRSLIQTKHCSELSARLEMPGHRLTIFSQGRMAKRPSTDTPCLIAAMVSSWSKRYIPHLTCFLSPFDRVATRLSSAVSPSISRAISSRAWLFARMSWLPFAFLVASTGLVFPIFSA